jgi:glutathione peroxidase
MSIYDIEVERINGELKTLEEYKGNVLLIVNTASKCGYTPQLTDLQELYEAHKDQGFNVLGFPSGQFLFQEYSTNTEIMNFCRSNYGVSFPMFAKTRVRGRRANPLFKYLVKKTPVKNKIPVRWNFEKFLINRNGEIINRYSSKVNPKYIKRDIEFLLQ